MGPRFLNRGNLTDLLTDTCGDAASMGPRFLNRGNYAAMQLIQDSVPKLQWGRGFSTAEMWRVLAAERSYATLQWGRGFSTAEIDRIESPEREPGWLQWGRGFSTAEMAAILTFLFSRT